MVNKLGGNVLGFDDGGLSSSAKYLTISQDEV